MYMLQIMVHTQVLSSVMQTKLGFTSTCTLNEHFDSLLRYVAPFTTPAYFSINRGSSSPTEKVCWDNS